MAMNGAGDALIVWHYFIFTGENHVRLQARFRSATGVLGSIQNITRDPGAQGPQVAINGNGDAVIVWHTVENNRWRVQARFRFAGGAFGPVQNISRLGTSLPQPKVAISANGDALIVWTQSEGASTRIQARTIQAGGGLTPIRNLSRRGHGVGGPQLAMNANGDAMVVWLDGTIGQNRGCFRSGAAGTFSTEQTLSRGYQVAMDGNGNALHVWIDHHTDSRVRARTRSAAGELGPVKILSPAGGEPFYLQVAMNPAGKAVVAWREGSTEVIQARARTASGGFRPLQDVSAAGAFGNSVAMGDNGDALVVWQWGEYPDRRIQASAGP